MFENRERNRRFFCGKSALFFLVPAALFVAMFFRPLFGAERFSYRDVGYYYYPLFEQIQNEWNAGRIPLWDPFENLGQPLAGNPTASVFYPVKIIFFLSTFNVLKYATCFNIYIWIHHFLSFLGVYLLSRRLKISRAGSTLAGCAFAFSGQTFFQYSNVVYLVGSAWLPFFLLFAFDFFSSPTLKRKLLSAFKLSVVQSLSILGGEPQIVYLATIAFGFFALIAPLRLALVSNKENPNSNSSALFTVKTISDRKIRRVLLGLIFGFGVAASTFFFSAIQILPSLEIVELSSRSCGEVPRSFWEIPSALRERDENKNRSEISTSETEKKRADFYSGFLCGDLENGGRNRSIYRFSVGPWRWLEFLFPNVGGRQFPQAGRWFSIFPEEIAVWTPTLYFGVVPFLLAVSAARWRRKNAPKSTRTAFRVWLSWLVVAATLGALGGFGGVWAARFFQAAFNGDVPSSVFRNGDPIGGLYWLFNLTLPKFAQFRYPAKLLTLSAVGLSVLSGFGWDEEKFSRRFFATAMGVFGVAVATFGVVSAFGETLFSSIRTIDPLYGPFQPRLAFESVRGAFAQTAVALGVSTTLLLIWRRFKNTRSIVDRKRTALVSAFFSFAILATTAIDVYIANAWTLESAPSAFFARRSPLLQTVVNERLTKYSALKKGFDPSIDAAPPIRVYRFPVWFPATFATKSSPARTRERVVWDVLTLFPKYPYSSGIAAVDARGAVTNAEYAAFLDALPSREKIDADAAFLDVSYLVCPERLAARLSPGFDVPKIAEMNAQTRVDDSKKPEQKNGSVALKKIDATPNRIWIFRDGRPERNPDERAEIVAFEPNRIVYFVALNKAADLVFAEQYWPDWTANAIPLTPNEETELLAARFDADATTRFLTKRRATPTNSVDRQEQNAPFEKAFKFLRKATLPNGSYCVVATYRPRKLYWGTLVSAASWTAALVATVVIRRRRSRRRSPPNVSR